MFGNQQMNSMSYLLLLFLLTCSGLAIAAFVMALQKPRSQEGYNNDKSGCTDGDRAACVAKCVQNGEKKITCVNKCSQESIDKGCMTCAKMMKKCMKKNKNLPKDERQKTCIQDCLRKGCVREIPCMN